MKNVPIPEQFINDLENLTNNSIRMYLVFRKMTGDIVEPSWIHCGYDYLLSETKLVSKTQIRKGMIELVAAGWIVGFRRGYSVGRKRVANQYCISPVKEISGSYELMEKMLDYSSKRNRIEKGTRNKKNSTEM